MYNNKVMLEQLLALRGVIENDKLNLSYEKVHLESAILTLIEYCGMRAGYEVAQANKETKVVETKPKRKGKK